MKQYVLNLTPHERQELWKILDQDMVNEKNRKFNFLQNNSSSISMLMIVDALLGEQIFYRWHPMVPESLPQERSLDLLSDILHGQSLSQLHLWF